MTNGGIQLTVTPASSAFFSGEQLEYTITFRNTRAPAQRRAYHAPAPPRSASGSHSKHLSTSVLPSPSSSPHHALAASAPATRSAFNGEQDASSQRSSRGQHAHAHKTSRDLSSFVSPDNRSASSSHIMLPERRGVIGTPLALSTSFTHPPVASTSASPSASLSPSQYLRKHPFLSPSQSPLPSPSSSSLYPSKRLPGQTTQGHVASAVHRLQHKKNDYSIAEPQYANDYGTGIGGSYEEGLASSAAASGGGVSDLSSQLAGMALLQARERGEQSYGADDGTYDENAVIDARPSVEQYKRHGDALQSRYSSYASSQRTPSSFSTISEEGGPHSSPPTSTRFMPRRAHSYSSAASGTTSRVPSNASTVAEQYDHSIQSSELGLSTGASSRAGGPSSGFYGVGGNDSFDSVLRDTVTDYMRPSSLQRNASGSAKHLPPNLRHPSSGHGRSYSTANLPISSGHTPATPQSGFSEPLSSSTTFGGGGPDDPGTESLLWAFVQFTGNFTVEEALVKDGEFVAVKQALFGAGPSGKGSSISGFGGAQSHGHAGHAMGGAEYAIGGGSLDTEAGKPSPYAGTMSGKLASWLWGTNSSSSASAAASATQHDPRSRESTASSTSSLPVPTDPGVDAAAGRRRSSAATTSGGSVVQGPFANSVHSLGSLEERRNRAMNDKNYPVFSSPPSILAVDLTLEPGESKSYTFSLQLPGDLPPSFRGKAISFNYTLMVGTNRAPNQALGEYKQHSRLIRVPVRVYNNVSVTGVRPFYDLTNPIIWLRDEAKITTEDDDLTEDDLLRMSKASRKRQRQRSSSIENAYAAARKSEQKRDFMGYATKLLDAAAIAAAEEAAALATSTSSPMSASRSRQSPSIGIAAASGSMSRSNSLPPPPVMDKEDDHKPYSDGGPAARPELLQRTSSQSSQALISGTLLGGDGEDTSCKSAVEIVSRNAQKVSYDITKDGYRIAVLTLVKSAYRLGETVNVMITMNEREARVLRIAARLETHELIETTVSIKPAQQVKQLTRRLHAEHHETTLDSGRAGFALAIPSGATPDFATSGVKLQWSLRVAFLIIPPQIPRSMPGMAGYPYSRAGSSTPGASMASSASSSASSLPLSSPQHTKTKSFAFSGNSGANTPVPVDTGSHHLLPLPSVHPHQQYTSYRAVPDLSFLPTLFQSPEAQATAAALGNGESIGNGESLYGSGKGSGSFGGKSSSAAGHANSGETVVLMPTKIETVEVSLPLRVYPSATPFRPAASIFAV